MSAFPVCVETGPFVARVSSNIPALAESLRTLYGTRMQSRRPAFADFHVEVTRPFVRRWFRPQARFLMDGQMPFKPVPEAQAPALFEWGLNACIGGRAHQYLIFHAAVVERGGRAAIMPAAPGSGKSTLAAALVQRGWRLLSDEMTLLDPRDGRVVPLARPISLKNTSIDAIRAFAPDAVFGAIVPDTMKGTIGLLCAPEESVARVAETAAPRWIVFPRWEEAAPITFKSLEKSTAMMEMVQHSINYDIHGARGFAMTADLVDACDCLRFTYSGFDDAIAAFEDLAASP